MFVDLIHRLGEEQVQWTQRRIYAKLDDASKANIVETAVSDINNILSAMVPAKTEILLHRNVGIGDVLDRYNIGEIIEFHIISSTSTTPGSYYNRGYSEKNSKKYEISVPPNGFLLELDRFSDSIRNEVGEILLPPMKCKVKNIRLRESPTGDGDWDIIELEYVEGFLDINLHNPCTNIADKPN